jgi:hypothetical protein
MMESRCWGDAQPRKHAKETAPGDVSSVLEYRELRPRPCHRRIFPSISVVGLDFALFVAWRSYLVAILVKQSLQ